MILYQTKLHEFSLPRTQKQYQPWSLQVIDNQRIGVFYVQRFQIWNYISKKLIFSSEQAKLKGFWNHPKFISKTDLIVFTKNSSQDIVHLSIHQNGSHKVTNYSLIATKFEDRLNKNYLYDNLIYCQKSQTIYTLGQVYRQYVNDNSTQSNKNILKLNLNTKQITNVFIFDGQICKYNQQGIAIFRNKANEQIFQIVIETERNQYPLKNSFGCISVIKEYSPQKAIIGYINQKNNSIVLLYSLKQKTQIKLIEVALPSIKNLVCFSDSWIAMTTVNINGKTQLLLYECLFQSQSKNESQILIQQSVWNYNNSSIKCKQYYFIASAGRCVEDKLNIKIVQLVMKKRLLYIHLLEQSGMIQAFENQLVKAVINNLF